MIKTAFHLRINRARALVESGAVQANGGPGCFDVTSQSGNGQYHVAIVTDSEQNLVDATCTCPDWATMAEALSEWFAQTSQSPHPGIAHVHGIPTCKHVLAAAIQAGVV